MADQRKVLLPVYMLFSTGLLVLLGAGALIFALTQSPGPMVIAVPVQKPALATPVTPVAAEEPAEPQPAPEPQQGEKAIAIKSDDYRKQYADNAAAADQKFKDKLLEMTGEVTSVLREPPLVGICFGKIGDQTPPVLCEMDPKQLNELAQLKPGQKIVVRGYGMSQVQGGFVGVGKCKIVKPSK